MSGYSSVFWLSLCASLTAVGVVLSIAVGRRRGFRSVLHGAAWSLIPLAAYMTGSTLMLWRIGVAIGKFGSAFVFSPLRWAGIAVAGLVVLLFLASGGRERRKAARAARAGRISRKKAAAARPATAAPGGAISAAPATRPTGLAGREPAKAEPAKAEPSKTKPSKTGRQQQAGSAKGGPRADDDLAEVEEILRRRGILPPAMTDLPRGSRG